MIAKPNHKEIEIYIENIDKRINIPIGTTLLQLIYLHRIKLNNQVLGAFVNNELEELGYQIFNPKNIRFIDINNVDGMRMYTRSVLFLLYKAVYDLYPNKTLKIEHAVSKGLYCEFNETNESTSVNSIEAILKRMKELVDENLLFERREILLEDAVKVFTENKYLEKAKLFKNRQKLYTTIYKLDGLCDYFYGHLVPSTSYLKLFNLENYYNGMLLLMPKVGNPSKIQEIVFQPKLFEIFQEYKNWGEILKLETIGSINEAVINGKTTEIIQVAEALHEKKLAQIADIIEKKHGNLHLILISGPSSSGKTTFSKRLSIQLKVLGLKPRPISLDNYFVNRKDTPIDDNGDYNYESLNAIDVKLLNEHLVSLLDGKETELPKYSFETGERFWDGKKIQISEDEIIVLEGIHALNPKLTPNIDNSQKFKIYVSALTQVGIDWRNRIPTTDNRLLRRIVRDNKYRGYSALETLQRWPSVRRGEEEHIFPYQEEADIMFNSALMFELGVLKKFALPLLQEIFENEPQYAEARRLLKFLSYFEEIKYDNIPPTSILLEFLGGSSFKY
ncbi:MAG: nucleoside kinase [Bacteroidales bacterium]|nr:nucleoside kinase [Bacteroidales bacterium]